MGLCSRVARAIALLREVSQVIPQAFGIEVVVFSDLLSAFDVAPDNDKKGTNARAGSTRPRKSIISISNAGIFFRWDLRIERIRRIKALRADCFIEPILKILSIKRAMPERHRP